MADPVQAQLGITPGKVIAVHLNYASRAAQRGRTPAYGSYFLKPTTSLAGSGEAVVRPDGAELLGFEGEIALIIGTAARNVGSEDGWSHVGWVTAANDLGLYDLRYADRGSNLRAKGGDGYTPLGPTFLPAAEVDPGRLRIRTWVNDTLVQDDHSGALIFSFAELVADLSRLSTLRPGDVILTGTPAGASVVVPGDRMEVEVSCTDRDLATGRLCTEVVAGPALAPSGAQPKADAALRADAYGTAAADEATSPALPAELVEKLTAVGVATLSAVLRKRGISGVHIDGVHPAKPGEHFAGRAKTLRYLPLREDLFAHRGAGFNAQKRAIDTVGSGDVLVMEARGERGTGTVGDILALRAQVRGAAAIVTDGGIRDSAVVADLAIPVFHAGAHPAVLGRRHVPWESDVAIACGGATVLPGDVVVGDDDGVIVIPPDLAEEVADTAAAQEREERFITEQVRAGASVDGLYPLGLRWRQKYDEWVRLQDARP